MSGHEQPRHFFTGANAVPLIAASAAGWGRGPEGPTRLGERAAGLGMSALPRFWSPGPDERLVRAISGAGRGAGAASAPSAYGVETAAGEHASTMVATTTAARSCHIRQPFLP